MKCNFKETYLFILFLVLVFVSWGCVTEPEFKLDNSDDIESSSFIIRTIQSYQASFTYNDDGLINGALISWKDTYNQKDSLFITKFINSQKDTSYWVQNDITKLEILFTPGTEEYVVSFLASYNNELGRNTEFVNIKLPKPKFKSLAIIDENGNFNVFWDRYSINSYKTKLSYTIKDSSSNTQFYWADTTQMVATSQKNFKSHFTIADQALVFNVKTYLLNNEDVVIDSLSQNYDYSWKNNVEMEYQNGEGLTYIYIQHNKVINVPTNFYNFYKPTIRYELFKINNQNDTTLEHSALIHSNFYYILLPNHFEFEHKYFANFYVISKFNDTLIIRTNTIEAIATKPPLKIVDWQVNYESPSLLRNIIITLSEPLSVYDWNLTLNLKSSGNTSQISYEHVSQTQFKFYLGYFETKKLGFGEIQLWLNSEIRTSDTLKATLSNDFIQETIIDNLPDLKFKINSLKTQNFAYTSDNRFVFFYYENYTIKYKIFNLPSEPLDFIAGSDTDANESEFAIKIDTDKWVLKSLDDKISETIIAKTVFPGFVINDPYERVLSYFAIYENKIGFFVYDNSTNNFLKKGDYSYNPATTSFISAYRNTLFTVEQTINKSIIPIRFYYNSLTNIYEHPFRALYAIDNSNIITPYWPLHFMIFEPNTTNVELFNSSYFGGDKVLSTSSILYSDLDYIKPTSFTFNASTNIVYKKNNNWFVYHGYKNGYEETPYLETVNGEALQIKLNSDYGNFEYANNKLIQSYFQLKLKIQQ